MAMFGYSRRGWEDSWDIQVHVEDGFDHKLSLHVAPSKSEDAPHCFVATVTIAHYELVREPANVHANWEPRDPKIVYHGEHLSMPEGIRAARAAARRAETIRCGPGDES